MFKTADGQFGVSSPEAQSGDQICVLLGCDALMILRATQNGAYLVVGSYYMQVVYDSKALLGSLPGHIRRVLIQENGTLLYRRTDSCSVVLLQEDPRLESLDVGLDNYRESGEDYRLEIDSEVSRQKYVDIKYFDLV
jgi:hypothetical protein